MPICNKTHIRKVRDTKQEVPCYFIAGICIVDPIHEGALTLFLRATYPYHHSPDYQKSKLAHNTVVPNTLVAANANV